METTQHNAVATKASISRDDEVALAALNEIPRLLDELNDATLNLEDATAMLDDRLRSIKRNEPTAPIELSESNANTDLGSVIAMYTRRVRVATLQLTDARNKLEI